MQCFKCHQFGHMAKACRNNPFCHKCGGKHQADRCKRVVERSHCADCKKEGHKPWVRECPGWRKEKARADEAYRTRPWRYPEGVSPALRSRSADSADSATTAATLVSSDTRPDSDEGFTMVTESKRRKLAPRGPGRPSAMQITEEAARGTPSVAQLSVSATASQPTPSL